MKSPGAVFTCRPRKENLFGWGWVFIHCDKVVSRGLSTGQHSFSLPNFSFFLFFSKLCVCELVPPVKSRIKIGVGWLRAPFIIFF